MEEIDAKTIKVVITGPESSGKTTLCRALTAHYGAECVPEYARKWLTSHGGRYQEADLLTIARGQAALEDRMLASQPRLLLCDTGLEVIRIWSEWKYGRCHPWILREARRRLPDLYLLLRPDLPWQPDPLRETPGKAEREELYKRYRQVLDGYGMPCVTISGTREQRLARARAAVDALLAQKS